MNDDLEIAGVAPDVILPGQITCGARCDGTTSGARALMTAILDDALLCIARGRRRSRWQTRRLAADAEAWVRADDPQWLLSFASICGVLGIDADALRDRILTDVECPPRGAPAASAAQADDPSTRSGAVVRILSQCTGGRGSTTAGPTAGPRRRSTAGGPERGAGVRVRALAGAA